MTVVGITGTNGKTTTSFFLSDLFEASGRKPGLLGTVEYRIGLSREPADLTTPDGPRIQSFLGRMLNAGITHVISEVSSHAICEGRVDQVHFDLCIFTNLSPEHLRFHRTIDAYFKAKARLFEDILSRSAKNPRIAVINLDDRYGRVLYEALPHGIHRIGFSLDSHGRNAESVAKARTTPTGYTGVLVCEGKSVKFTLPRFGRHNLRNALVAATAALALGIDPPDVEASIQTLRLPPGRFEIRQLPRGAKIVIDYAHTPRALRQLMAAARETAVRNDGRVVTLLGCGGERDSMKRSIMTRIASERSDFTVLTEDNPRSENLTHIFSDMTRGIRAGVKYCVEPDRFEAIRLAFKRAGRRGTVVLIGKGHEFSQTRGASTPFFNDLIATEAIAAETAHRQTKSRLFKTASLATTNQFEFVKLLDAEYRGLRQPLPIEGLTCSFDNPDPRRLLLFDPYLHLAKSCCFPSSGYAGCIIPRPFAYWLRKSQPVHGASMAQIVVEDIGEAHNLLALHFGARIGSLVNSGLSTPVYSLT